MPIWYLQATQDISRQVQSIIVHSHPSVNRSVELDSASPNRHFWSGVKERRYSVGRRSRACYVCYAYSFDVNAITGTWKNPSCRNRKSWRLSVSARVVLRRPQSLMIIMNDVVETWWRHHQIWSSVHRRLSGISRRCDLDLSLLPVRHLDIMM